MLMIACTHSDVQQPVIYSDIPMLFGASDASEGNGTQSRGLAHGTTWTTTPGSQMAVSAYHYASASSATPQRMLVEKTVSCADAGAGLYRWDYSPVIYWPHSGKMDFYAYAPAKTDGGGNPVDGENTSMIISSLRTSHIDHQGMLMDCHVPASEVTTIHQIIRNDGLGNTFFPNDEDHQVDAMFAMLRNRDCAEVAMAERVNLQFAHAMASIKLELPITGTNNWGTELPGGGDKTRIVVSLGRIRTGGTLAVCEPATPGRPDLVWTLDGTEGTFYATFYNEGTDPSEHDLESTWFFPPQTIQNPTFVLRVYTWDTDHYELSETRTIQLDSPIELEAGTQYTYHLRKRP
ncbi:MAG: fimbrillin family protein [Paludibacteraceae bacterium]|nr:fimbrillin family protein [Paludibacteraceae bacterium]